MATLETFLTSIADAIREKKGTSEPIKGRNFTSEILSIQGGGSLNLAYGTTPPTDTSKIWLQCEEPQAVEVQNYIGECAVSEVANYGVITNPVAEYSEFRWGYYTCCYIDNNQIAIVGYNHVRIYDLTSKKYIADYTISVGTGSYYSVIHKDNILYFAFRQYLYSYDLTTKTLTNLMNVGSSDNYINYIYFYSNDEIDCLYEYYISSGNGYSQHKRYKISTGSSTTIPIKESTNYYFGYIKDHTIKLSNTVYNFYMYETTSNNLRTWKYDLSTDLFTTFTSFYNFMLNLGWTLYYSSNAIYDGERYIYLIGGIGTYNGTTDTKSDLIIKYDTINDSFEVLGQKLIEVKYNHYSELVDNRVYIFGGQDDRKNQIDYFDLQYPLTQNNCIITTNTINTDNTLPLINTEKLKLNSNIASAYKGNANNLAEKVNAYYYDGSKWVGINCEDYVGNNGAGGGLGGGGDATTDPDIPVDKPVEM